MNTYTENVGEKLNDLLERTYDAEKGFKKAAENVEHSGLRSYFHQKAQERYDFGHQLKTEIKAFGQEIEEDSGSVSGTLHRVWMDTKALFSADDEESMLEEAIRGEKEAIDEYCDILEEVSLPESTKRVLMTQKNQIESGLTRIKTLEDLRD